MALTLIDYMPDPVDLDVNAVLNTRKRLAAYLAAYWPSLESRPNSPFGDAYLTPMATIMTAAEVAMDRFKSDLDLSNPAAGKVYDTDFVTAFVKSLGIIAGSAINSSGTIRMVFSTDKIYIIDASTSFTFGSSVFSINPEEGNPIYIYPTSQAGSGRRVLTRTGSDRLEIHLPVVGTPGASVSDNDSASISASIPELLEIRAAGPFDSGQLTDSVMQLASKAQKQFPAAGLVSRSSVISFASARWPNIIMMSATVSGDREMLRSGTNPLGIREGAIDLFIRSRETFGTGEAVLPLTYDSDLQAWVGRLNLPTPPAFFDLNSGVFQVNNFQTNRGVNKVYSKSLHPTADGLSVSYSRHEALGILVKDTNPVDFVPAVTGSVTALQPTSIHLVIRGEYAGNIFSAYPNRSVVIRVDEHVIWEGFDAVAVNVRDSITGETGTVYFTVNNSSSPTKGIVDKTTADYQRLFKGLDMEIVPSGSSFDPASVVGLQYEFAYQGRTANFSVNYFYEPFMTQVESVVQDTNFKPVNVEPFVRSFIICHVTQLTINCKVPTGTVIDTTGAQEDIVAYINSLAYPKQYDESSIMAILSHYGVTAIQGIIKRGYFYPSLASVLVDKNGVETNAPRVETTSLIPTTNDFGFGVRNVAYYLQRDAIQFNVSAN